MRFIYGRRMGLRTATRTFNPLGRYFAGEKGVESWHENRS
jgi:hypothetical protein